MKVLVVGLKKGSQITRLQKEAFEFGVKVEGCRTSDLVIESGSDDFLAFVNDKKITGFNLIYLCAGIEAKKRYEWYVVCEYLRKYSKTKVVSQVVADASKNFYPVQNWFFLKQYQNKIPFPKTYSVFDEKNLKHIVKDLGFPVIVKLSEVHKGKGVFLANKLQDIQKIILNYPNNTYLVRQFIKNNGDIRVFVVGYKAVAAMRRIPKKGEFRSNISAGGKGEFFDLDKNLKIKKLAEKAARVCGIEIAGVDIMIDRKTGKEYVLEVNTGPQFKGLESFTSHNVAKEMVKYFVQKMKNI